MGYGDSALPIEEEEAAAGGRSQRHDRRGIGYGALAAAVILVLLAAGALGWALFRDTGPQEIRVPSVVNQDVASAQTELEERGLELGTQTQQADPNIAVGLIITQDPEAQELLEEGGAVNVVVSTGAPQAQVPPGLIGMQFNEAQQAIQDAGLRIGSVTSDDESDAPDNEVTATDPAPGTEVATGTPVNITISGGQVAIPNVVGQDQGAAQATLDGCRVRGPRTAGDRHRGAARHGLRAGPVGWGTATGRLARGHPRCPGTTGDPVTVTHPNHRP